MANKFYKVIKENPLWKVGAILQHEPVGTEGGYRPLEDTDMWDVTEFNGNEYLSARIIENSPTYFQRVYPVNLVSKTVYRLKEEAREFFEAAHRE